MRKLIANADDYGLTPGVSRGIRAAASGIVRSTTVLANLACDADLAQLEESGLQAGAHLNLSLDRPLTMAYPGKLLDAQGCFIKALALEEATWNNSGLLDAVGGEWKAQIESLLERGVRLTHVDSHHHVHLFPALFELAARLAAQFKLGIRTDKLNKPVAQSAELKHPELLLVEFFGTDSISKPGLARMLKLSETASSVELMCHPGFADDELKAVSGYTCYRGSELAVLRDIALAHELTDQGWILCGYGDL